MKYFVKVTELHPIEKVVDVEADNKIFFIRNITGVESFSATVTNSDIIDIQAKGDANDMCNQFTVPISFTVTSNSVTGFRQTISHWPDKVFERPDKVLVKKS